MFRAIPVDGEGERRTVVLLRTREGVAVDRTIGALFDRDGADRRTVGARLGDGVRLTEDDLDRLGLREREILEAERRGARERETLDETRGDRDTDREGEAEREDRLNERADTFDRLGVERARL